MDASSASLLLTDPRFGAAAQLRRTSRKRSSTEPGSRRPAAAWSGDRSARSHRAAAASRLRNDVHLGYRGARSTGRRDDAGLGAADGGVAARGPAGLLRHHLCLRAGGRIWLAAAVMGLAQVEDRQVWISRFYVDVPGRPLRSARGPSWPSTSSEAGSVADDRSNPRPESETVQTAGPRIRHGRRHPLGADADARPIRHRALAWHRRIRPGLPRPGPRAAASGRRQGPQRRRPGDRGRRRALHAEARRLAQLRHPES